MLLPSVCSYKKCLFTGAFEENFDGALFLTKFLTDCFVPFSLNLENGQRIRKIK